MYSLVKTCLVKGLVFIICAASCIDFALGFLCPASQGIVTFYHITFIYCGVVVFYLLQLGQIIRLLYVGGWGEGERGYFDGWDQWRRNGCSWRVGEEGKRFT